MKPVEENIARLLAEDLDEAGKHVLASQLEADPEAAAKLGGHLLTEGLLGVALEDEVSAERWRGKLTEALHRADQNDFLSGVQRKIRRGTWQRRISAIAAMVAIGFSTWMFTRPEKVGTVTRLATVTWGDAEKLVAGSALKSGTRLRFESGLVELEMGGRGRMIVEGPADLELSEPMGSVLHRGRILMRVTEAGHGYRVKTSKGAVIDLGTEFGVSVDENQQVETHVLDGEVEALPDGGRKELLKKNDALRFDSNGGERIAADGGSFYTTLPPIRTTANMIRWPLETAGVGRDRAEVRGFDAPDSDMILRTSGQGSPPSKVPGVFGSALSFDGKGGFAESAFPGIGGNHPRTVSFWVKVPEDFSDREGFGIVSWGDFDNGLDLGGVWQVSINPLVEDGPIGHLRVGTHGGLVIGGTDLRDGQWHHVAVVLYQASQTDIGKHVLIYLNGALEPISRRALREVNTKTEGASHGVWLGRNVANNLKHKRHEQGFFRGSVDEVFIFDGALTQDEIRILMERNEAPR